MICVVMMCKPGTPSFLIDRKLVILPWSLKSRYSLPIGTFKTHSLYITHFAGYITRKLQSKLHACRCHYLVTLQPISQYVTHAKTTTGKHIVQVYVPQNTLVPQNTSRIYFQYKIWKKRAKYFILVNIY